MKRIRKLLSNNRGDALIFGVFVMLTVLMIFYCVLAFVQLKVTTANIQTTAEQVLDTYTSTQGRNAVESIKNGTDYTVVLDQDLYVERFQDSLGIGNSFIGYNGNKIRFQLADIHLNYTVDRQINSSVTFHLSEPLYFFGAEVTSLSSNVTVYSKYNIK